MSESSGNPATISPTGGAISSSSETDRNTQSTLQPIPKGSRPRAYSSRSKENLMQAVALDNPYSPQAMASAATTTSQPNPTIPNENDGGEAVAITGQTVDILINGVDPLALDSHEDEKVDSFPSDSTTSSAGSKSLSGPGIGSVKRPAAKSDAPPPSASTPLTSTTGARVGSASAVPKSTPGATAARARSHTVGGSPAELAKINTPGKSKNANVLGELYANETLILSTPDFIYDSFAYFCIVDYEPRRQRKILFAVNQRHGTEHHNGIGSNRVLQDMIRTDVRGTTKRGPSLGGLGGKLNSLLRSKKQKRTRSGIFHSLSLSIHDFRINEGLSMVEILSEATVQKKRTGDTNKTLLHAMCHKLQTVAMNIMEKGYPSSPNNPVFASNEKFTLTFPSYFQLAVSLDLVEVARVMIKNRADVDVSWYQITPIMMAVLKGSRPMLTLLLESEANPSQRIILEDFLLLGRLKTSKSAVRAASRFPDTTGCGRRLDILGDVGADLLGDAEKYKQFGQKGTVKLTPEYIEGKYVALFEMAALKGDYQMASYLLGMTNQAIIASSSFSLIATDNCEWAKQVIAAGVPLTQRDAAGSTCLHLAARRGDLDMVVVILQGGMDINSKGANGWTALHEAVSMSHIHVCQYLLYKGADQTIANNALDTPFGLAEKRGFDSDTLDLFFKEKGDLALFSEREKTLGSMENVKHSESFPNALSSKIKGSTSSSEKGKFGGLFGKNGISASTSASSLASSKSTSTGKRGFFGRASVSNNK